MNENILLIMFGGIVVIMLMLDLGIFNKKQHKISAKEATVWTIIWIALSLAFSGFIYYEYGSEKAIQYLSAYFIEKSLSLDNIFVFVLIFGYFTIKNEQQHKVLFWGILGAIIFRAIFIFSGLWLINITYLPEIDILGNPVQINLLLTIFALILIVAGIKSFGQHNEKEKDFSNSLGIKIVKKFMPIYDMPNTTTFFTKKNGIRYATPLFLAMITIEISDIVFAVDSIPAIFAISQDPIILYTSNIFAILGLRSMYFVLENVINYFSKLKQGIAVILIFIGGKMLIADFYHISSMLSLFIILGIIAISIVASILTAKK